MPNMPIYTQQTTPNGNMAVQAQGVNIRDPYGPAIQDLGQGIASLGQNLGNIQRVQIERANQLQADKDDLWAASTVADIDIKMTKRMADLSVDPTVTELTPVIEKEIDTMLEENGKDASDQQKKLLDKRSVGFRRELITAAIGRDVAHSIATTEASLEKLGQSRASKVAFNAPEGTWDPAERAVAAWKADQEVSAEIDKAHIAPQQKLVQKTKLKAGLVDAYMGRFVEVDPDMAMAALSGEIKDGPVAEMVKQIPASAIDSYRNRAQSAALAKLGDRTNQAKELQKAYSDAANKQAGSLFYAEQLTPDTLETLGKHMSADELNGWRKLLYTQTVVPMQKAQKDRVEAVVLQNTRNNIEMLKNQGKHDQVEPLIQGTDLSPERKKELSADSANPSNLQATVAKATEDMTKAERGKLDPRGKRIFEDTDDYRDLSLAAELTINKYRNAGIAPETEIRDTLNRVYYNLKTDKDAAIFSFPRPGSGAKINFNFPTMSADRATTLYLQARQDLNIIANTQGVDSPEFALRVRQLDHISRMYKVFYGSEAPTSRAVAPNTPAKPTPHQAPAFSRR